MSPGERAACAHWADQLIQLSTAVYGSQVHTGRGGSGGGGRQACRRSSGRRQETGDRPLDVQSPDSAAGPGPDQSAARHTGGADPPAGGPRRRVDGSADRRGLDRQRAGRGDTPRFLGASIEGNGRWSPLEDVLYWGSERSLDVLLKRGARIDNLRKAAGLGQMDVLAACFDAEGKLTPAAGQIASPFERLDARLPEEVRHSRQQIIDNALVYAAGWGREAAMRELLDRGADINACPAGFDFSGTARALRRSPWPAQHGRLAAGAGPTLRCGTPRSTCCRKIGPPTTGTPNWPST